MRRNTPLGLPIGSVRSVLAILFGVTACVMGLGALAYGLFSGKITDPTAIIFAIIALANGIVLFYFKDRDSK